MANIWQNYLNQLNADKNGLKKSDFTDNETFLQILNGADFPTSSFSNFSFSRIIFSLANEKTMAALDNSYTPNKYWNSSMEQIFDNLFSIANPDIYLNESAGNPKTAAFRFFDILSADAGFSFDESPWVIPWKNRRGESYSDVRKSDLLEKVLNDDNDLQFTNSDKYEKAQKTEDLTCSSLKIEDGQIIYTDDEDDFNFNQVTFNPETGEMIYTYDEEIGQTNVVGVFMDDTTTSFLDQEQLIKIVTSYNKWIRLLMPTYLRNVEVEDLNRNFWVIGQVLDLILYYLDDPNGVLGRTFKDMANELEEMWNNVEYLWGRIAADESSDLPTDLSWHVEVVPVWPHSNETGHTYNGVISSADITDIVGARQLAKSSLEKYKSMYLKQNLALIPEVKLYNFIWGYAGYMRFPGVLIYKRYEKDENDQIIKITNPTFEWICEDDNIPYTATNNTGNQEEGCLLDDKTICCRDTGSKFIYGSYINMKNELGIYWAFRPIVSIMQDNQPYDFANKNLPDNLQLVIKWEDVLAKAFLNRSVQAGAYPQGEDDMNIQPTEIDLPPYGGYFLSELLIGITGVE